MALQRRLRTPSPPTQSPTADGGGGSAEDPAQVPRYRIGFVAELTGVSRHALRAWERRYQALGPRRTAAGDRLYCDEDVHRVRLIRDLSVHGHTISAIAHRPTVELEALRDSSIQDRPEGTARLVARVIAAIEAHDYSEADLALAQARDEMDAAELVKEVTGPIVLEMGIRADKGELDGAQIRLTVALLRSRLDTSFVSRPAKTLLCQPAAESDELGTLYVAVSAAARGWLTVYLSPGVPSEVLEELVRTTSADAVVVTGANGSPSPPGTIGLRLFGSRFSGPALESVEDVDRWLTTGTAA